MKLGIDNCINGDTIIRIKDTNKITNVFIIEQIIEYIIDKYDSKVDEIFIDSFNNSALKNILDWKYNTKITFSTDVEKALNPNSKSKQELERVLLNTQREIISNVCKNYKPKTLDEDIQDKRLDKLENRVDNIVNCLEEIMPQIDKVKQVLK